MTGRLILVRHGESAANVVGSLDTQVPGPPLSALGQEQATALVGALAEEDVRAVWASTMTRAQQTAAPLAAALGLEVRIHAGLREADVGALNRRHDEEAHGILGDVLAGWMLRGELSLRFPGGESGAEVTGRVRDALMAVLSDLDGGVGVVVGHGAALRTTAFGLCGLDPAFALSHHLPNTGSIVVDVIEGRFVCWTWAGLVPELALGGSSQTVI